MAIEVLPGRMLGVFSPSAQSKTCAARTAAATGRLQLDEVYIIVHVDPKECKLFEEHGNDVEKLPRIYARITNDALSDIGGWPGR